ncbi:MAG: hypothetical protein CMH52_05425 [Myxococcales bacterium]|nr:hypothetical protein [Myxococcales bacterium]|tara:strand:- start:849 stop:1535 length:687 start_codon:yes stop_codon:yes gene_type:complete
MQAASGVMTVCLLFGLGLGTVAAQTKSKPVNGPVTIDVSNQCKRAISMTIGSEKFKLEPAAKVAGKTLAAAENDAYGYNFAGSNRDDGFLVLKGGGAYGISIHSCGASWASVATRNMAPRPTGLSPNAEAKVRFRSFRAKGEKMANVEYRPGKRGRFKRLSVAFTPYVKSPAGPFAYGLKLKAGRMGPVLNMFNGAVKLEAGKNYLIEASVVGGVLFTKFEDEGFPSP